MDATVPQCACVFALIEYDKLNLAYDDETQTPNLCDLGFFRCF
ncbi:hypothetical protein AO385_1824 [Moraxella catarrhalis]|uniref:Uncharacterized protein n=1 Tax=Moraxella catarrhalis TaxID=480 RepID=A0A198UMM7_MORCA|nr:hypothetical protein AO383_1663 [Moraxella catarrhalis]OAU96460.1 hypothetical protein AO385_1824 [Moraxella catarrhalis]OAU97743.1 hypothetical protein AO384_0429 [Moraxella catarrhalis]OAV01252.1 hypothetical protein AO382_0748 [Moraxella catarrhalis]